MLYQVVTQNVLLAIFSGKRGLTTCLIEVGFFCVKFYRLDTMPSATQQNMQYASSFLHPL